MSEREKRLAVNEALFREINERVAERVPDDAHLLTIVCECADADCTERITLTAETLQAVRGDPTQFVVSPGHVALDIEDVVARGDQFEVVRKRGLAGEIVEFLDGSNRAKPETA